MDRNALVNVAGHKIDSRKRSLLPALMFTALTGLTGCQHIWYAFLNIVVDTPPDRFALTVDEKIVAIPIMSSGSLTQSNPNIEELVVIIHGAGLNAIKTFDTANDFVESMEIDENRVIVIAPQFLEGIDVDEDDLLVWSPEWRSGGESLPVYNNTNVLRLSSFKVIDELISKAVTTNTTIRRITVLGHSAGGQFVQRYAVFNQLHDYLEGRGISFHYIVANPSSYLYFDSQRYQFNSTGSIQPRSQSELDRCQGYNHYKYGLESLPAYGKSLSPNDIENRALTRSLATYLNVPLIAAESS